MIKNIEYLLALHTVAGLGPIRLKKLIELFKDPKTIWQVKEKELVRVGIPQSVAYLLSTTRKNLDPLDYCQNIDQKGISYLTVFDLDYPKLLKKIYDPPVVLYYFGNIKLVNLNRCIAVVGSRLISSYGRIVTEKFTQTLSETGLVIVSGLARGVDSLAHKTCLDFNGKTVAVLGGGLNKIYPPENKVLAEEIVQSGGLVLSEFPPDQPPYPGNFPSRNRVISGVSLAVLVTEAAEDSGSLITAKLSLEQGREVFAVPGPITSKTSTGTALLIKEGASLVTDPKEILEQLGIERDENSEFRIQSGESNLSEIEEKILNLLENEQKHIDEICRDLKLSTPDVSSCLIKMEIKGLVKSLGGGIYIKSF